MIVAYLVNQYPQVSHTFIAREIAALEALGATVLRLALRPPSGPPADPIQRDERARTRYVLDLGAWGLGRAVVADLLGRPRRFLRAARAAWRMGGLSERGRGVHLIYLAEACVVRRWLRRGGATHLHAHFGTNSAAVARLCRTLGGPPYSITIHGPEEFDAPRALDLAGKVRDAAFVVAVSEFGRSQIWRWAAPEDWPKVQIVRCGVDAEFLRPGDAAADPGPNFRRLVCVGRLAEQKGQLVLVEAARLLAEQGVDFELALIGDGPMRGAIDRQIARHGLESRVHRLGALGPPRVRAELLAARGLVLPSFAEGLPVVLMESLALGRPVVATFVAGIPELVRDGENGFLVPAGSAQALAGGIRRLLDAPVEVLTRMGRAGAETVRRRHDAATEAEALARLFFPDGRFEHAATSRSTAVLAEKVL